MKPAEALSPLGLVLAAWFLATLVLGLVAEVWLVGMVVAWLVS